MRQCRRHAAKRTGQDQATPPHSAPDRADGVTSCQSHWSGRLLCPGPARYRSGRRTNTTVSRRLLLGTRPLRRTSSRPEPPADAPSWAVPSHPDGSSPAFGVLRAQVCAINRLCEHLHESFMKADQPRNACEAVCALLSGCYSSRFRESSLPRRLRLGIRQ
jgi:hypothetical protein